MCVGSVGCEDGTVNLYDNLYHTIILNEVQEQVANLVGCSNLLAFKLFLFNNRQMACSDCGVFSSAFATCLGYGIHPEKVQFNAPKMRTHPCQSLKSSALKIFPTF